jgi:hypothetical protein
MTMAAMNMGYIGGFLGISSNLRCPQGVASVLCKKTLDHLTVVHDTQDALFSSSNYLILIRLCHAHPLRSRYTPCFRIECYGIGKLAVLWYLHAIMVSICNARMINESMTIKICIIRSNGDFSEKSTMPIMSLACAELRTFFISVTLSCDGSQFFVMTTHEGTCICGRVLFLSYHAPPPRHQLSSLCCCICLHESR